MHKPEFAEQTALMALTWLVGNDDLLPVFMGATGAGADDLRAGANDADFLASVLDFLMMDDAWVVQFCDAHAFPYDAVMKARQGLPGGAHVSWT